MGMEINSYRYSMLAVDKLQPDPSVPQRAVDQEKDHELAESVGRSGILQPLLVRTGEDGNVFVVAGQRRLRAAQKNGLPAVPCMHVSGDPVVVSIVENLQREDLSPLEEAEALNQLISLHPQTHEELGCLLGKKQSTITEILSINKLSDAVKKKVRVNPKIAKTLLVELAKKNEEEQARLLDKFLEGKLSREDVRGHTRNRRSVPDICISELKHVSERLDHIAVHAMGEQKEEFFKIVVELQVKLQNFLNVRASSFHRLADDEGENSVIQLGLFKA